MSDTLDDVREQAWNHVFRSISDHYLYNHDLAGCEIYEMNASEATAVLTMPVAEMLKRWAYETQYAAIPMTGALGEWLRTKDDINSTVIEALDRLRVSERETGVSR